MPRPIWSGHIAFGLVSIPVGLHSADQTQEVSFHMIDRRNNARIRYKRVNEETGEEVPWDEIVKSYEFEDGTLITVTDEDLKQVAPEATQAVEIVGFTELVSIEPGYFEKPYYLVPQKRGEKGYVLLRTVLSDSGRAGIAKVVLRNKEHLAVVYPQGNALKLGMLRFSNELRDASEYDLPSEELAEHKVSDKEVAMARQLVDAMSESFNPEAYKDTYTEKLMGWLEERHHAALTGKEPPKRAAAGGESKASQVVDFADLLKKSLERRGAPAKVEKVEEVEAPRKKARTSAAKQAAPAKSRTGT